MMKLILVLSCVLAVSTAKYYPNHMPLSGEMIHYVNKIANSTWQVSLLNIAHNPMFISFSFEAGN